MSSCIEIKQDVSVCLASCSCTLVCMSKNKLLQDCLLGKDDDWIWLVFKIVPVMCFKQHSRQTRALHWCQGQKQQLSALTHADVCCCVWSQDNTFAWQCCASVCMQYSLRRVRRASLNAVTSPINDLLWSNDQKKSNKKKKNLWNSQFWDFQPCPNKHVFKKNWLAVFYIKIKNK